MGQPLESVWFGKRLHFRMSDGIFSRAAENREICVINDAHHCAIAPESESLMEKTFHPEPVEISIEFDISHLGVTQIEAARDNYHNLVSDSQSEGAGIVLHLLPGDILHLMAAGVCFLADTELPNHTGKGGIADHYSILFRQDLVYALHISIAAGIEAAEQFRVYLCFITSGVCGAV